MIVVYVAIITIVTAAKPSFKCNFLPIKDTIQTKNPIKNEQKVSTYFLVPGRTHSTNDTL